jgi:hypothetical protein
MGQLKTINSKYIIFYTLMVLLCAPLAFMLVLPAGIMPLKGSIEEVKPPNIAINTWFNEEFQKGFEKYINQNFGFRNILVRLHNQIDFTFLNKINAREVIIGKENYLYENNYIQEYIGANFIGEEKITERINKLKLIEDTLLKLNKQIVVIIAPGKASFYPEYIPDSFLTKKKPISNYKVYSKALLNKQVPFIDFNKWFIENKNTVPFPLYGKCGIHWSKYGEYLVADSILKYIHKNCRVKVKQLYLDTIVLKDENQEGDYDIGEGLNLLFRLNTFPMAYPQFYVGQNTQVENAKVMVVSDSYYWGMYSWGMSKNVFNNGQFWYYNDQIYADTLKQAVRVFDVNLLDEVNKHQVILLVCTEGNLFKFGFNFVENLYDAFYNKDPNTSSVKNMRLAYLIKQIKSNQQQMKYCMETAAQKNETLDHVIRSLAEYLLWAENNNQ